MEKVNVLCAYNGIIFSLENKKTLLLPSTWRNQEEIPLSEISQQYKQKC
jgi:hypothetical protein